MPAACGLPAFFSGGIIKSMLSGSALIMPLRGGEINNACRWCGCLKGRLYGKTVKTGMGGNQPQ
jgi:hypothetical protein